MGVGKCVEEHPPRGKVGGKKGSSIEAEKVYWGLGEKQKRKGKREKSEQLGFSVS